MTATHVNGLAVVEDQPARSGISRPGVNVVLEQTRHLLLADGSEVYGCLHCNYTSENKHSIRPHLKKHKNRAEPRNPVKRRSSVTAAEPPNHREAARPPRRASETSGPAARDLASLNLGQLVERAQLAERMRSQRDTARTEAAAARRTAENWKEKAADYRKQWLEAKNRAERAEKRLAALRALLR
ncbi:hypothetical protein ACGRHY_28060 [Streptomyces sp. HK10]|uniref:hypothetical protein n=1 Tax=Streptomyces sp. HK10 TaxID=3373255 RepID=UPI003747FF14